jgi:co-chaperonin GroES (HSP10)
LEGSATVRFRREVLIQPRNDRVLIKRLEEPQKGLIVAPEIAKDKSIKGKVLAVGPKVDTVKAGDLVYFHSKWNDLGTDFQHVDFRYEETLHLVQVADIFAIINNG